MQLENTCLNCDNDIEYESSNVGSVIKCPECNAPYIITLDCYYDDAVVILIPVQITL